jgi:hypothetical protein
VACCFYGAWPHRKRSETHGNGAGQAQSRWAGPPASPAWPRNGSSSRWAPSYGFGGRAVCPGMETCCPAPAASILLPAKLHRRGAARPPWPPSWPRPASARDLRGPHSLPDQTTSPWPVAAIATRPPPPAAPHCSTTWVRCTVGCGTVLYACTLPAATTQTHAGAKGSRRCTTARSMEFDRARTDARPERHVRTRAARLASRQTRHTGAETTRGTGLVRATCRGTASH